MITDFVPNFAKVTEESAPWAEFWSHLWKAENWALSEFSIYKWWVFNSDDALIKGALGELVLIMTLRKAFHTVKAKL